MHWRIILLLLFSLQCSCDDASNPDVSGLSVAANLSNSMWCTDVLNPALDYLLNSSFVRDAILSEPIPPDGHGAMGFKVSGLQVSGAERLERAGNLYAVVRSGNFVVLEGAIRAVEVAASFVAKFSVFKPDNVRMVVRGTVVRFGFFAKLETGQRATLMSLKVTDLGRIEVSSKGRLSAMIRKAMNNRLTRSRIAKTIGSLIRTGIMEKLKQFPLV